MPHHYNSKHTAIDFTHFMQEVEDKHGFDLYDLARCGDGLAYRIKTFLRHEHILSLGYTKADLLTLDKPVGSITDWAADSEEMKTRIKINSDERVKKFNNDFDKSRPYINYWHWMLDRLPNFSKGRSYNFYIHDHINELQQIQEKRYWLKYDLIIKVLQTMDYELTLQNYEFYEKGVAKFYIDW